MVMSFSLRFRPCPGRPNFCCDWAQSSGSIVPSQVATLFSVARSWSASKIRGVTNPRLRRQIGNRVERRARSIAAVGDERNDCLACELVRRQERPHRSRQCHAPDRKADKHRLVGGDIRHALL